MCILTNNRLSVLFPWLNTRRALTPDLLTLRSSKLLTARLLSQVSSTKCSKQAVKSPDKSPYGYMTLPVLLSPLPIATHGLIGFRAILRANLTHTSVFVPQALTQGQNMYRLPVQEVETGDGQGTICIKMKSSLPGRDSGSVD